MNKETTIFTKRNWELIYPVLFAICSVLIVYLELSTNITFKQIIHRLLLDNSLTLIITIETTLFGFLLAVLALILQMNNKFIDALKEANRYKDLISFCKKAVYSTFVVIIVSILILLLKDLIIYHNIKLSIYYIFGFTLVYNILTTYRFVKVFFLLANSN